MKKIIKSSSFTNTRRYVDYQGILGEIGERYTMDDLRDIYEYGKKYDPVIMEYSNFKDWLSDTMEYLKVEKNIDECRSINSDVDYTYTNVELRIKRAKQLLQRAYDMLQDVGDYGAVSELIDYTLVDDLDQLIRNIDNSFNG